MYDCVIVGGGPCGVACAIYLKQAGYKPVIVENELIGGQPAQTTNITNVTGFIGNGNDFCNILNKQIEDNGIEVIYGEARMKDLDVYIDDKLIDAKTILIASGSTPNKLDELNNPHYCALCDGPLYKDKEVIVIGGGNSAYTEALHLSNICKKVTLLQNSNFPVLANNDLQNELKLKLNTQILPYSNILKDNDTSLSIVCRNNVLHIPYDGIFVCIGRKPNIDWIEGLDKLEVDKDYNLVQKDVAIKDIFAGGDVLNKPIKQISTAINDGVIISQNVIKYLKENN